MIAGPTPEQDFDNANAALLDALGVVDPKTRAEARSGIIGALAHYQRRLAEVFAKDLPSGLKHVRGVVK